MECEQHMEELKRRVARDSCTLVIVPDSPAVVSSCFISDEAIRLRRQSTRSNEYTPAFKDNPETETPAFKDNPETETPEELQFYGNENKGKFHTSHK